MTDAATKDAATKTATKTTSIDLNSDLGESYGRWTLGDDAALFALVSSANIACGFHAGDPTVLRQSIRLALKHDVAIGAHPGYADLRGFGRVGLDLPAEQLRNDLLYQLSAIAGLCRVEGATLRYVKPHGALYNQMNRDDAIARTVVDAVAAFDETLPILLLASSTAEQIAQERNHPYRREAFIDRGYLSNGQLQPRTEPGSVIDDPIAAADRALRLVQTGEVTATDGTTLSLRPDSLCLHGDTPGARQLAELVKQRLDDAGVATASCWDM